MVSITRREAGLGVAALAAMVPGAVLAQEHAQIPFRVTRNRPWTVVSLDGNKPVPFLIDMGAGWFCVDDAYAAELKLPYEGDILHAQTAGGETRQRTYQVGRIQVGGVLNEQNTQIYGWEPQPGKLVKGLIPAAKYGVVGFDFDKQIMTCDRFLSGAPAGYQKIELANKRVAGESSHIAHEKNISQTVILGKIDGREMKFIVDTGATDSIFLFPHMVRELGLWEKYTKFKPGRASTLGATIETREVLADSVSFGNLTFKKPFLTLADPKSSGRIYDEADGLLGMEMLRRINFILDGDNRAFWIKPNSAIDDVYRYDRAGVWIADNKGDLRVTGLGRGPAAKAGLRMGDKVTGWGGSGGYFGLMWALQGAPGDVVSIQVERDGKPEVVNVTLEEPGWTAA